MSVMTFSGMPSDLVWVTVAGMDDLPVTLCRRLLFYLIWATVLFGRLVAPSRKATVSEDGHTAWLPPESIANTGRLCSRLSGMLVAEAPIDFFA
jgi:hypothetical protein